MPITTIPIIARTNTIDEWRIQTNASANDLNDLGFYTYDKDQGTLILSNTSVLNITAEGTPLQVANNVLFSKDLTLGNNLFLGVQSSGTGNLIAGSTVSVRGPGRALSVSNNSYVGVNLEVVRSIYTGNVYANNDVTIGDNLTVDGVLTLPGTGEVIVIEDGIADINNITSLTITSANISTSNLYAAFARVDVLDDLAFARIGILENVTANCYYLSSNSHTSNTILTRYLTANISGNIVNFSSDTSNINSATILSANIVLLDSNNSTLNVSTINTAIILNGDVQDLFVQNSDLNVATINVSTTNNSVTFNANIISLTSNSSLLNVATVNTANITWLYSSNTINANTVITNNLEVSTTNVEYVIVSSNLWVQSGATVRVYSPGDQYETVTIDGRTTLSNVYIRDGITVEGTWTQLGAVEYEINEITLNARTPTNADATIRNYRVAGDPALIRWNESDDRWTISRGNTYDSLFSILDSSLLDSSVSSLTTGNVATPLAVNTAHSTAQTVGRYANAAFAAANTADQRAVTSGVYANAAFSTANANTLRIESNLTITGDYGNSAYIHANAAYESQNTTGDYANSAYGAANVADQRAVTSGVYANSAYAYANTLTSPAASAGSYANAAFETANTGVVNAAIADEKAVTADGKAVISGNYANSAYAAANTADQRAVTSGSYANSAFAAANTGLQNGGTINGNLVVNGRVDSGNIKFDSSSSAFLQGSKFVFNANQNQNQGPSLNAVIEVDRGTAANSAIRYLEESDIWQFSHDGVNYATLGFSAARANNIQGGAANRVVFQTAENTTGFVEQPSAANYYLKWTGSAITWAEVPIPNLATATFSATQITSGTIASARLSGQYAIDITGSAGSAATAASATTAGSTTNATNATNVILGGSVTTGIAGQTGITNYGNSTFFGRATFSSGGTTTSRTDPNNTAAIKVVGDVAVSNDVWAIRFQGVATSALYADLAEKYLADKKYPIGTIMMIGGKKEITAAKKDKKHAVIGIVSANPAYIMNSDLKNGTMVGLKGRLPIRLIGKCEKGDLITISDKAGIGEKINGMNILPFRIISLVDKETEEEGLIEVFIS
jgi:hypothetical protein